MQKNRKSFAYLTAAVVAAFSTLPALAGQNDFFGAQSGSGSTSSTPIANPADAKQQATPSNPYADPVLPHGDFTEDEKRMQKKYRASVRNAKDLIAKGTEMMEVGQRKHNDKVYKKGKVLKDIGEKQLAELKENNPLADLQDGGNKRKQTAD